jgi:hypothetical protein
VGSGTPGGQCQWSSWGSHSPAGGSVSEEGGVVGSQCPSHIQISITLSPFSLSQEQKNGATHNDPHADYNPTPSATAATSQSSSTSPW